MPFAPKENEYSFGDGSFSLRMVMILLSLLNLTNHWTSHNLTMKARVKRRSSCAHRITDDHDVKCRMNEYESEQILP
jgi:hypothetical protein